MLLRGIRTMLRRSQSAPHPVRPWHARPRLESLEVRAVPATLAVGKDLVNDMVRHTFSSIQAAIDAAAPDDTIRISAGTYTEQLTITKDNVDLIADGGKGGVTIQAPSGASFVIHVSGAQDVDLRGLTVTGPARTSGQAVLGPTAGIVVDGNGSANIVDDHITGIRDFVGTNGADLGGRQEGVAIQFGPGHITVDPSSGPGSGRVERSVIDNYQKNGIQVSGPGSSVRIVNNTITGAGPTAAIAQNGIQVNDGAKADIERNTVTDNNFSPPTTGGADAGVTVAVGIAVFNVNGGVVVAHNTVLRNDVGILLDLANGVTVTHNRADRNDFDGIALISSDNNTVEHNSAEANGQNGLSVDQDSTGNTIRHNRARNNASGDMRNGSKDNTDDDNDTGDRGDRHRGGHERMGHEDRD